MFNVLERFSFKWAPSESPFPFLEFNFLGLCAASIHDYTLHSWLFHNWQSQKKKTHTIAWTLCSFVMFTCQSSWFFLLKYTKNEQILYMAWRRKRSFHIFLFPSCTRSSYGATLRVKSAEAFCSIIYQQKGSQQGSSVLKSMKQFLWKADVVRKPSPVKCVHGGNLSNTALRRSKTRNRIEHIGKAWLCSVIVRILSQVLTVSKCCPKTGW